MTPRFRCVDVPPRSNPDHTVGNGILESGHGGIDEWEDVEDFPPEGQQMPVRK